MRAELTPAAQRALQSATAWTSARCTQQQELGVPEILMGLLAEPECRAALLLATQGIDATTVRDHFSLVAVEAPDSGRLNRTSQEWIDCLSAAERLLMEYPQPLTLATEHLLLGVAAADNEVSRWLADRGLLVAALEAEVHRLNGYEPGPLPIEVDEEETSRPTDAQVTGELSEHERVTVLRVIDAAANRAGEGLRVVEDYLRFVLDDRHLTAECKSIRHELVAALEPFSSSDRHAARDTRGDVGTDLSLASEQSRPHAAAVAGASFKRVEQALRSLEEFSKSLAGDAAARFEQLRYRAYTLERAAGITADALQRLAGVRLYVLIDGGPSVQAFGRLVEALVSAGVGAIQLRDKRLSDRALLDRARLLREQTGGTSTLTIMNDRADLAVLSGADGVHVGQEELTVAEARRVIGPRGLIGVSTHSLEQARGAVLDGASYIGVGPTFPTDTKRFAEFPGTALLARVASEIRLPAFAIGGITLENLPSVLETGVTRVALSSAIAGAVDPAAAAAAFLEALSSP